jgi:tRNA(Arg) A34 adenosine deaminase TadA
VTTVTNQPALLSELSEPERACLALAWEAMLAGTNPIGAVVVDPDGMIVASGRSAVYGPGLPGQLSGSRLAHAEVNAMLRLPVNDRHSALRLMTSLEPCQMCTGALRMATVGSLTYIGADPVHGTAWALESARYVNHRPVQVTGPREDGIGRLASGLVLAYALSRNPAGKFVSAFRDYRPELGVAADALIRAGLFELAGRGVRWSDAAPSLLAAI